MKVGAPPRRHPIIFPISGIPENRWFLCHGSYGPICSTPAPVARLGAGVRSTSDAKPEQEKMAFKGFGFHASHSEPSCVEGVLFLSRERECTKLLSLSL